MATNQKRIAKTLILVLAIIIFGIIAFYGDAFYGNPVERSSFVCREADGTVHTEESIFGCGWIFDWKRCTKESYIDNTCTELKDGCSDVMRTVVQLGQFHSIGIRLIYRHKSDGRALDPGRGR